MTAMLDKRVSTLDHKYHLDYDLSLWPSLTFGLARQQGWKLEYAEQVLNEAIRFYIFCGQHQGEQFVCSAIVDKAADYFLLRTQDHHRFCDIVIGRFIHHIPLEEVDGPGLSRHHLLYLDTLVAMGAEGHYLDPLIWTSSASPCSDSVYEGACVYTDPK